MHIAVVGATGRIGAKLTEKLLANGHSVKALSRGGAALDALVGMGAEPSIGSFDTGAGEFGTFFKDVDAAFLMVKTLWDGDLHGQYPAVALRFFDALRDSPVKLAVNLTAMGSEVSGNTGHFQSFHILDQILNRLRNVNLVHLRAGYFMDDLARWTDAIARYDRIGWSLDPDVRVPWVGIEDIVDLAAKEFDAPTDQHRSMKELGIDHSMNDIAAAIGRALGRTVDYRFINRNSPEVEAVFRAEFGSLDRWLYDNHTYAAINDGRIRFHDDRPTLRRSMEEFIGKDLAPLIEKAQVSVGKPKNFLEWSSQR